MDTKELEHHAIQIEKLLKNGNYEDISSLLADLSNSPVSLEQLQTTDIAKTVYQLLKSYPVQRPLRRTAKELLSKWKRTHGSSHGHCSAKDARQMREHGPPGIAESLPSAEKQMGGRVTEAETALGPTIQQHTDITQNSSSLNPDQPSSQTTAPLQRADDNQSAAPVPENCTGVDSGVPLQSNRSTESTPLRTKCVEFLLQALTPDQKANPADTSQLSTLAQAIEQHIHALHSQNQAKYKSCIRSRVANLKNPKNPHLCQGLLTGTLAPEVFACMSVEEMAGEELRRLREEYTTAAISEHQLPQKPEGTSTTKVRCRRCQGMNCRVTQVSRGTLFLPSWVRSGNNDEDAMTFMTCSGCGEQWYHNRWVCL